MKMRELYYEIYLVFCQLLYVKLVTTYTLVDFFLCIILTYQPSDVSGGEQRRDGQEPSGGPLDAVLAEVIAGVV
jgi:hypothetical protein